MVKKTLDRLLNNDVFVNECNFLNSIIKAPSHEDLDMHSVYQHCRTDMIQRYQVPNYVMFELAYHKITNDKS